MLVSSITRLDAKVEQTLSPASVTRLDAISRSVGRAIDNAVGSAVGIAVGRAVGSAMSRAIDSAVSSAVSRSVGSVMGRSIGRDMSSTVPFVRIGAISVTRLDAKVKLTVLFTSVTRLDTIGRAVFSSASFVIIGVLCLCFVRKIIQVVSNI